MNNAEHYNTVGRKIGGLEFLYLNDWFTDNGRKQIKITCHYSYNKVKAK